MFDMLVVQSNGGLSPLTPVSTSPDGHHHHPTDLSPRSVRSTSSSLMSNSPPASSPTPTKDFHSHIHHQLLQESGGGSDDFSALQRLQYALERNSIFFQNGSNGRRSPSSRDIHLGKGLSLEDGRGSPMIEHLNTSLEDSGPRSTDSSSNLIESPTGSPNTNPANIFQCPLCSLVLNGRHSFNEHLVTHTQQHVCPKCDFLTNREENLRDHLQECHDMTDGLTDDEVRVPKMNSQGKVKTFKCKQCQHVSITKMEFWAHSKSHIRQEKMLTCPKCPFVTEYKHHLEYHLRNHFGSKPFQCTECPYSCVNKSMLNSHLKSHSNIYQYRCADCSYATKYCHSLKLHLRKYSHNPSAVLNPDGSQNPLTIIDVYGTRRGPKVKRQPPSSDTPVLAKVQVSPASTADSEENGKTDDSDQISSFSPITKKEINKSTPLVSRFASDTSDSMSDTESRHHTRAMTPNESLQTKFSAFQSPIHMGDPNIIMEQMGVKTPIELYTAALNQFLFANPILRMQPIQELAKVAKDQQDQIYAHVYAAAQAQNLTKGDVRMTVQPPLQTNQTPLDLTQGNNNYIMDDSKKRKRKGKAHRYERQVTENLMTEDDGKALDFSKNNQKLNVEKNVNLICKYCEISFLDQVLYTMHMNYHSGDNDPFLCKSCGKKTPNKIAFSVHLTTDPH